MNPEHMTILDCMDEMQSLGFWLEAKEFRIRSEEAVSWDNHAQVVREARTALSEIRALTKDAK